MTDVKVIFLYTEKKLEPTCLWKLNTDKKRKEKIFI